MGATPPHFWLGQCPGSWLHNGFGRHRPGRWRGLAGEAIEAARRFEHPVFFGDATRLDMLRTVGPASASILVVAVGHVGQNLEIVELSRSHIPHLQLVVRACEVVYWNLLRARGISHVQRELFESSLYIARCVLELLDKQPHEARVSTLRFRQHNLTLLDQMYPHHQDQTHGEFVLCSVRGSANIE